MARKLALKRLTNSDLTFFQWKFENHPAGNQKAVNLNADVFVDKLYPGLSDPSAGRKFPMDLFIYGPGKTGAYNIQRKIVRSENSKNWRLNGETIPTLSETTRFNVLEAGDFAIFDFNEGMTPSSVTIVFIATGVPEDRTIHDALDSYLGPRKMIALSSSELESVVRSTDAVEEHPIFRVTVDVDQPDSELEEVALGGSLKPRRRGIRSRPSMRVISREDLLKAKENADSTGRRGEQFVNDYLTKLQAERSIRNFRWVSDENAVSSYDFRIHDGVSEVFVDVKSTQGEFERDLHVSYNELLQMATGPERYDIYRVYEIKESSAQLRIARDMKSFSERILSVLNTLPEEITSDSISFPPSLLQFEAPVELQVQESTEE